MKSIDIKDINIKELSNGYNLRDLKIEIMPNEHATAFMDFDVLDSNEAKRFIVLKRDDIITIQYRNQLFFIGNVQKIVYKKNNHDKDKLEVSLKSLSGLVDSKKRKRSFQNIEWTFERIMAASLRKEKCTLNYCDNQKIIKMPLIQYNETAWEFVKRLASRINSVIYPKYNQVYPEVQIGLANPNKFRSININSVKLCFDRGYWSQYTDAQRKEKSDYIYYDVYSYENAEIGEGIIVDGKYLIVLAKKVFVNKEQIIFEYHIGMKGKVLLNRYNNKQFAGLAIKAKVLSVTKETLRLKFDFDEEQEESTAYDYCWVPETGNTMYLMPQKETKVNLFFKNETEESAIVINCIRNNGNTNKQMRKTDHKYLTNDYGKQMQIKEDSIGFINENSGEGIMLYDGQKIGLNTSNNITMVTQGAVHIATKNFILETPNEW